MTRILLVLCGLLLVSCQQEIRSDKPGMGQTGQLEQIGISSDGRGFICMPSGRPFHPWGNNYGNTGRLIEDFWGSEWPAIAQDFQEMKSMGANVVRVHLQFGKFMPGPDKLNPDALDKLAHLLRLAEETGLYLDVTGLACYRKADVPAWYDALSESDRWNAQARFWEGVASQCANSSAIFCYDLINEPITASEPQKPGDWYAGAFGDYEFIQFINLDPAGRSREKIALQWGKAMTRAIHKHDRRHLITVGMLPITLDTGVYTRFRPKAVAPVLDFISVHIYPETGKVKEALATLQKFAVGKPLVVEETFPLACSGAELKEFLLGSRRYACGWMGHYNGESIRQLEALRQSGKMTIQQSIWLAWLQLFRETGPAMASSSSASGQAQ
jgi:hypothetical protein